MKAVKENKNRERKSLITFLRGKITSWLLTVCLKCLKVMKTIFERYLPQNLNSFEDIPQTTDNKIETVGRKRKKFFICHNFYRWNLTGWALILAKKTTIT